MKKISKKKLQLSVTVVRSLDDKHLDAVAGGKANTNVAGQCSRDACWIIIHM